MCEYVSKEELKEPKRIMDCWIRKVQQKLKVDNHIHFSCNPIGSGKRNMVIRQCNKQTFDMDYQIVLTRLPKKIEQIFSKNAKYIKDLFRKTFDEFKPHGFSSFEDSTQALTTFNKKERFGYDIIITRLDEHGNTFILYNKKNTNAANNNDYCWEQKKDLSIYRQRLKQVKGAEMWNEIKNDLDDNYEFGKYIITGSTTPINPERIQHSGAGRITPLTLRPFTLYESGDSNGLISLEKLIKEESFQTVYVKDNRTSLADIAFLVCRGGWPISTLAKKEYAIEVTKNYYAGLFNIENESDEFAEFLKNKDIELLKLVLKSYARNISTQCKKTTKAREIIESGVRSTLDEDTFTTYENILKSLFIIFDMPAWNLNLRTSVSVRTTPTHHFYDTSIATAALGIQPSDLLGDLKSFGYFFEDLVIRDLYVYAESIGATLKHYRDSSNQEVDAIVEIENGDYAAIEIKIYSENNVKEGIKSLISFNRKMKDSMMKLPKIQIIVTSHGPCYKTNEGIYIVPVTMLKN